MKELEVIREETDRKMFEEVSKFIKEFHSGMSEIQITQFVLNEIEFPTEYGQYRQAKFELISRYNEIVNMYFELKKLRAKIKIKQEQRETTSSIARKELFDIEIEELEFRLNAVEGRLQTIINEARVFYRVYDRYRYFDSMSPDQLAKAEFNDWAAKTKNMPYVFEERYGDNYMKKALGESDYSKYLEMRREKLGLLPREVVRLAVNNYTLPCEFTSTAIDTLKLSNG